MRATLQAAPPFECPQTEAGKLLDGCGDDLGRLIVGLIDEATVLIVQILERAIESFDSELNQLAVAPEADMERLGISAFFELRMPGVQYTSVGGRSGSPPMGQQGM